MLIVADFHLHVYPFFDTGALLSRLAGNLAVHSGGREHAGIACLAEREDCRWFDDVRSGRIAAGGGHEVADAAADGCSLALEGGDGRILYVIAGRQIVTSERLEVLALATGASFPGGMPAADTLRAVRDAGGVPVLPWGFGKWRFRRAAAVRRLIESAAPGELAVGDTALRPACCPEPSPMAMARAKGIAVVCGSDPLPIRGEEKYAGAYCTVFQASFDAAKPSEAVRGILAGPASTACAGRRCSLADSLRRVVMLNACGKRSGTSRR